MRYDVYTTPLQRSIDSPGRSRPTPVMLTFSLRSAHTSHQRAQRPSLRSLQPRSPSQHHHQIRRPSPTPLSRTPPQRRTSQTNSRSSKICNNTSRNSTLYCVRNFTNYRPTRHSPPQLRSSGRRSNKHGRLSIYALRSGKQSLNSLPYSLAMRAQ